MKTPILAVAALSGTLVLGACADTGMEPTPFDAEFAQDRRGPEPQRAPAPSDKTIAEIAEEKGFTLLLAAVDYIAADNPSSSLIAGLLNNDQYTVFAPTDVAFVNLVTTLDGAFDDFDPSDPFTSIDALLGEGTVEAVVSYHVTEGRRAANSVLPRNNERTIETLLEDANFSVDKDGKITAVGNTAQIILGLANTSASNGIVHPIDAVILPIDLGL